MSLVYELGISSDTAVVLRPEYSSKPKNRKQTRSEMRARSGGLYRYIWATYDKVLLNLNFVPASDASIVNSWWEAGSDLLLFITSDSTTEVRSVQILNKEIPFSQFVKPYDNLMKGKLELEGY